MARNKKKVLAKFLGVFMGILGLLILVLTFYPIVKYEILSRQEFPSFLVPLADRDIDIFSGKDYTKASNWFEGGLKKEDFVLPKVTFYNISIPKLRIDNAVVAIGGEDLNEHLIQYPGTALPGRRGNAVIFGHSILPRFYDPKRYISIFSLLHTLEMGDPIYVYYDGIEYTYKVEDKFEVTPSDIQVLEQNANDSYLTLVTCAPPGDPRKLKRLIVRARIVSQESAFVNDSSSL
jgi:sortase A